MRLSKTDKLVGGTVLGALAGGTIGLISAIPAVPINMGLDAFAPISYPTMSTLMGAAMPVAQGQSEPLVIAAGAAGGFLGVLPHIPLAPVHFCTRWLTTPTAHMVIGAAIGGLMGYNKAEGK